MALSDSKKLVVLIGLALAWNNGVASSFTPIAGGTQCTIEALKGSEHDRFQVRGVSWDGQWLAYTEEFGRNPDDSPIRVIYRLNLETGEKVAFDSMVTNSGAFSPDGQTMVAAFEGGEERTGIWEIEIESGTRTAIAPHEHWDWLPSYSPNGEFIVFNSHRHDNQADIFTFERESGDLKRMTTDPRYDAHGEYSPDGSKILFHRMMARKDEGGYDFELFTIDLATGEESQLTRGSPHEESYGSWAPDSAHVVFSSDHNGDAEKHNLYILNSEGEVISRLTQGDWKDRYAFWGRDGQYIYFHSDRTGTSNIYRIPMNGIDCR